MLIATLALATLTLSEAPAIDYSALLSSKTFNGNGGIQLERVFIQHGSRVGNYKAVIRSQDKIYGEFPMAYSNNPHINVATNSGGDWAQLTPAPGGNGVVIIGDPASVKLEIHHDDKVISSMPFKTSTSTWSGATLHHFDGPWTKYIAFSRKTNDDQLKLRVWSSLSEAKNTKQIKFTGDVKVNGQLVANTNQYILSKYSWDGFDFSLVKPDKKTTFTFADFARLSGTLTVNLYFDGKLARTHTAKITAGVVKEIAETVLPDSTVRMNKYSVRNPGNNDGDQILYLRELSWMARTN